MTSVESAEPVDFFRTAHGRFSQMVEAGRGHPGLIPALASEAFDLFEGNVTLQTEGLQVLACHKGCPACCCIRVTATAPEIFLLADYIRRVDATEAGAQLHLPGRIAEADEVACGLASEPRMAAQCFCPLMVRDSCIIHPVRPLACRGHASFDKMACIDAAAGREVDVPLSEPHAVMRSLVQNALQSALRVHGYAWRAYELIHGLHLALQLPDGAQRWLRGEDALEEALIRDTDWHGLAAAFDGLIGDGAGAPA